MALRRASGLVGAARKMGARLVGAHGFEVLAGLFDDHVGEEDSVGSGFGCGGAELLHAEADYGVEIGEEDEAAVGAGGAEVFGDGEDVGEAGAAGYGSFGGSLDYGAVG